MSPTNEPRRRSRRTTPSKRPKVPSRIGGNGCARGVCCTFDGVEIGLGLKLKAGEKSSRVVVQTAESLALIESVAGPNAIEIKQKAALAPLKRP